MKRFILSLLLLLSACQYRNTNIQSQINELGISSGENAPDQEKDVLISANGIGKARLGMKIGELKAISDKDTEFEIISPFIQDMNAIAVSKNDIVQYYILYSPGSTSHPDKVTPTNKDSISALLTNNHNYQTEEGVKVGTPIKEAEKIYGDAILAYNTQGSSHEYIIFNDHDYKNIRFRASYFKQISDGLGFSGIYPEYPGVSYTTDKYRSDAAIAAIEVSCEPETCVE